LLVETDETVNNLTMDQEQLFARYQDLQRYVGWTEADAHRIQALAALIEPYIPELINDFYAEIKRHPSASKVITGGEAQVERLKGTLRGWLGRLFLGTYDSSYVVARWQVGLRHVEIGLDQIYTNVALSRIRNGLIDVLCKSWQGLQPELALTIKALNRLLDLDLAIIEDAYQYEFLQRQKRIERLVVLGQMASGIAHELRNPLNVVRTSVFFLKNAKNASAEKREEHLDRIQRQVAVANDVITALSDFAKLPLPNTEPVLVQELLAEVLASVELPKSVSSSITCDDTMPAIVGDRRQLAIVFGNLIRNAIDAMPQGGQLTLRTVPDGPCLCVEVQDAGHGISPEAIHRIFEPFFSTKARGLGLGLAITKAIVENHGGQLLVKSQPGEGTCFTVRLEGAAAV
jgi:signal transduction histidine kinase